MKTLLCFRAFLCLLVLLAGGITTLTYGQNASVDRDRMERDIDIMEKVLNELFKNSTAANRSRSIHISSDRGAQGSYVPGYGVLFIAPAYSVRMSSAFAYTSSSTSSVTVIRPAPNPVAGREPEPAEGQARVKNKPDKDKSAKGEAAPGKDARTVKSRTDSVLQAHNALITGNMREFLVNYADAIGQLTPNERVMVVYNENARSGHSYSSGCGDCGPESMPRISAEVKREDLASYRAGKLNRKDLESRIRINQDNQSKENFAEYKVFAGILQSLYPVSQEVSYKVNNISYHLLPSFGVIYLVDMNLRHEGSTVVRVRSGETFSSSTSSGGNVTSSVTTKTQADSALNRVKENAFVQFKKDIKETMLDYGRTLRNLSPDQVILLSVALPVCKGCNVPERANVSVKRSVLEAYESNKMSRQQALEAISIGERDK
jgi:hypothetical protein